MGRGRFKAFIPASPPDHFVMPANGDLNRRWEKPVIPAPTTAGDVDKAKKRLSVTSNYNISSTDHFVGVNTSGGAVTLTLPATSDVSEGKIYIIKDEGGQANLKKITVDAAGADKIDGENQVILASPFAAIQLYCNGNNKFFVC